MLLSLKESSMKLLTPPTSTGNPGYVGRKRWAKPFHSFYSMEQPNLRLLRLSLYLRIRENIFKRFPLLLKQRPDP
jgi:hypothetical protein